MREFYWSVACLLLSGASVWAADEPPAQTNFYVAPDGNDAWTGRRPDVSADRSDGPLATWSRAQQVVRDYRKSHPDMAICVLGRGGMYRLDKPLVFKPEDSGTAQAPITYAAMAGEQPILSGGVVIGGWQRADGGAWSAKVPDLPEGKSRFRQLFVAGERRDPARSPNAGSFNRVERPLKPLDNREQARRDNEAKIGFVFRNGDLQSWPDIDQAVLVVYHSWTTSRHHVAAIDPDARTVRFTAACGWPIGYWDPQQRYYIEGVRAALDAPGEWYVDRAAAEATYLPRDGEDLDKLEVVAPRLSSLVRIEGDPANDQFVEHLRFVGLSFEHTDWSLGRDEECDGQAAAFLPDAAVMATGARRCEFTDCRIAHTGGYGLWLAEGCRENRVLGCELSDLGAGGIRIGTTNLPREQSRQTESNEVADCRIRGGGRVYHAGVGIWIGKSSHNHIHHNEVADLYYTGVSVGWSWGYQPSSAHHNVIEFNHLHHLGQEQLSDLGGIYTLGLSPGTIERNNLIHDVRSSSYGGWGIYPDEGSTDIVIENNVVYRTKTGGFHQHYGRDNVVRNNIFAFSDEGQIIRTREEQHRSFTFERNIVLFDRGTLLGSNWSNNHFELANNVYWRTDGKPIEFPGGRTLAEWQGLGHDKGSIVADPLFVDAKQGRFEFKADSPAVRLGFRAIDVSKVGPRPRKDKPK